VNKDFFAGKKLQKTEFVCWEKKIKKINKCKPLMWAEIKLYKTTNSIND
jgi:hypothetical protein